MVMNLMDNQTQVKQDTPIVIYQMGFEDERYG
jgi:hypothetical protein